MIQLRDYQLDVDGAIDECKSNRTLVVKPTGTGKTVLGMHYAISRGHKTLVLVHNEEQIEQWIDAAKAIDPFVSIGKFIGRDRDFDSKIIVATVQTLKNINNLVLIDRDFSLIIFDEAHHAVSETSKRILYAFGLIDIETAGYNNALFLEPDIRDYRKLIGLTATPERTDEESLSKIFFDRVDAPPLEWFIENGHLCDLKFISVDTGIDMSDVRSYTDKNSNINDLSEKHISEKLLESGYINELSRVVEEYLPDKNSVILYLPDVKTAKMASQLINQAGISSDYVVGEERDRRKEVIEKFKNKEIRVLCNCLVLKEGFDAPNVDAIILCRPTKSKLLLRQMVGRGTRNHKDKDLCTIVDLVVKRRQEDIISASGIFDELELSPTEQETMSVRDKIETQKETYTERTRLVGLLDGIRLKLELEEDQEEKKRRQNKQPDEFIVQDMPDSVSLLLDTRLMRVIGLDAKSFTAEFLSEQGMLNKGKPYKSWVEKESPHDYQLEYLSEHTEHDIDDLNMLKPMEAQSLINIMKRQTKPTSIGRRRILKNVYKMPEDRIPNKDIDARRLIKALSNRRIRHGRA